MKRLSLPLRHRSKGFSLIEVAISMAIVSFAMVSILGLIPMGMTNFQQAMSNTIESQIVQGITNELQLASFGNLKNSSSLYDADGNLTTATGTPVYSATVTVASVSGTGAYPVNLVVDTGASTTTCAAMVTISISRVNASLSVPAHVYSTIVANQNN